MDLPITRIAPGSPPLFPPVEQALRWPDGLLAVGGDLSVERVLAAYAQGIFPWFSTGEPILWWSPDPRCVFATNQVHVSRSLRRQLQHSSWTFTMDRAFEQVIRACAGPRGAVHGTWLVPAMIDAYLELHRQGHAHSVEVWDGDALVGGIYGVARGRLFCGESMFSHASGGSKAALLGLCARLRQWQCPLLDAQVGNPHLYSLGAFNLPRAQFVREVERLGALPCAACWNDGAATSVRSLA